MRSFFRIVAFLLMVGGSFEALGLLSHELDRTLSLLGLLLFISTFATELNLSRRPKAPVASASALCFVVAVPIALLAPVGLAGFHLLVLVGTWLWCTRAPRAARRELLGFVWALCIVVLLAELGRMFPLLWHMKRVVASELSRISTLLPRPASFGEFFTPWTWTREPRNLGPTAMGLPLLAGLIAIVLGRAASGAAPGGRRVATEVLALVVAHGLFVLILTPYASWLARHHGTWSGLLMNPQWLFLVIGVTVSSCFRARDRIEPEAEASGIDESTGDPSSPRQTLRRLVDPRVVSGLLLGVILVLVAGKVAPPQRGPMNIMFYDAGYSNWNVPQPGRYGENSAGMFGVLPSLLQAAGHQVERGSDLRRLEGPHPPDCLILINIQDYFDPVDRRRVIQFVRNGGGLLCLGDHTGVAGIRGPFNDLLAETGIRLVFDSATFFASGWSNALERRSHPVNLGVVNDEDYQIWVGASLDLDPGATPVVVARYGWSDIGDMANLRRAYLGDRRYNPDELLGDVVLVAEACLGHGKVLVFGDTSTYQNLSLPRSWEFVLRSIDHLGHLGGAPASPRLQIVILLAFATVLGLVTSGGVFIAPVGAACAGLLLSSAAWSALVRPAAPPVLDWARVTPPSLEAAMTPLQGTAIIDRSHGGRFDLRAWNDTSIGGLTLNLMRDGFFPVVTERFPWEQLEKADVVVLVAPQRPYSTSERTALRRFVETGGRLLVCVGFEEYDGARGLLQDYGFEVRDLPLAHFRTGPDKEDLVFLEGWSVGAPDTAEVLVRQWGQPVVARSAIGQGQIVLIGDTHYLLNRNLEGRETWFPGNIAFLGSLDHGRSVSPIEGKFGDPHEKGALVDTPQRTLPAPARADTTSVPVGGRP